MNITIKTIPHKSQKYDTVGDYGKNGKRTWITVSKMNDDYEFLVALHELIEQKLCEKRGIKNENINEFDINFEKERNKGLHTVDEEPGFDPYAPYVKEHTFATKVERMMARELNVNWSKYNKTVNEL